MRTLFEIIEAAKNNEATTPDECRYAMMAIDALSTFTTRDLRNIGFEIREAKVMGAKRLAEEDHKRWHRALNKAPDEWLGHENDPNNPDYQKRRRISLGLMRKVIKDQEGLEGATEPSHEVPGHQVDVKLADFHNYPQRQQDMTQEILRWGLALVQRLRELREVPPDQVTELGIFFRHVLAPFYDCVWDGLKTEAGHAVYRLSDLVPQEVRQVIEIYPRKDGWDTLEDFRREWEDLHPEGVPFLQRLLP
jgi:hypothetical protein